MTDRTARQRLRGEGDPSPRRISGGSPAVLALHGYGGTPREVEVVLEAASTLNLAGSAPLLPGHGTSSLDLARRRWPDWTQAAERAFDELGPGRRIVAGLSLGSLLAIHLAATRSSEVAGLVLIANATRLSAPTRWALRLWQHLPERLDFAMPKVTSDIADPAARRTHLTYGEQPVRAAAEVQRAGRDCLGLLARVRCPTLILHGARDRVTPVSNASAVERALGGPSRVVLFPRSRHILTRDLERAAVRRELLAFFESIAHQTGGGANERYTG